MTVLHSFEIELPRGLQVSGFDAVMVDPRVIDECKKVGMQEGDRITYTWLRSTDTHSTYRVTLTRGEDESND